MKILTGKKRNKFMEKGIAALDDLLDEMDYISQPTTLC
jgi:hypothetical protein